MKPPMSAVGRDASRKGRSFTQSTKLPRLNSQVEYDAATMLSSNAVGRISFEGNKAKAISARKAVPPAWPTVAYSKDTAPNSSANMISAAGLLFPDERLVGKPANVSRASRHSCADAVVWPTLKTQFLSDWLPFGRLPGDCRTFD